MTSKKLDPAAWTHVRPAEIKTYHRTTYDRISPSNTFNGQGKTVLVTAGGALFRTASTETRLTFPAVGIGFAIAESFAKAGVERLVLIQRRPDALETAKQTIESKYSNTKTTIYVASVTDFGRISEIVKQVGKIDVLVANAAMSHPFVPSKDVTVDDFKATFDTNVVGAFHIIKEFLALASAGPRQVILTSSAAGQNGQSWEHRIRSEQSPRKPVGRAFRCAEYRRGCHGSRIPSWRDLHGKCRRVGSRTDFRGGRW